MNGMQKKTKKLEKEIFFDPPFEKPEKGTREEGGKKAKGAKVGTYSKIYSTPTQSKSSNLKAQKTAII